MNRLPDALDALRSSGLDGWLLYDFRGSNPLLWQLLGVSLHSTRRVFLLLRPSGDAALLVHQVDAGHFP
ncbi:MAG: aminopeptidase P family protein, partial [Chloroflexota bacterium]